MAETLVLGLGNILMGDEGVGIAAVKQFDNTFGTDIEVLDGGTGGFHLLSLFSSFKTVIIVDAAFDENPPGTISVVEPRYSEEFPKALSSHDIGLKDLIETASILGQLPRIILITITVKDFREVSTQLSAEVEASIPEVHKVISNILHQLIN
jgi:hydrogenase maturation protease